MMPSPSPRASKKLPLGASPAGHVVGGDFFGAEMSKKKTDVSAGSLPESFVPGAWPGTTHRRGGEVVGLSFDLVGGDIARLAVPVESARMLMDSLKDYLDTRAQSSSESGSPSSAVSGHLECENVCPPSKSLSADSGEW